MSLLPGQIIPASMPIGKLSPDGKSVLIDENWWLFLYNIYLNSVNADVAGGFLKSFNGRTVSAAVPTTGDYKLSMLSDVSPDSWNDRDVLAYSSALAKWTASPQSEMTIVVETANGLSGTVVQADNEQQITLSTTASGVLKGVSDAIESAVSGVDFSPGTSALATGILKTTTGTGALSVAVAADFPILNQNTTGNAATVTTNANLTGPVTSVGNATSVTANAITNAMLAEMPTDTIKGNNTAATANAIDLTATQVTAMLDAYAGSAQGVVPAGSGGTTNYLREDGTWAVPSGSATWGSITGTLSNQTDLVDEFALYGALANGNNWSTAQYFTAPYQGPFIWFRETTSGPTTTSPYSYFANNGSSGYTICNFEWYDGTNYFQGWRSNYNSGAPTFDTYRNTLDDGAGNATFAGHITGPTFQAAGLTGAVKASRYVGATASGAPTTGTFALGDFILDQTGTVWICTTAGTPGTWVQIAAGNANTVTTNADLTGPVTSSGNATSVTDNAITNAMLAQAPTMTVKGNNTASTADELDLTQAQLTAMVNNFTSTLSGAAPSSGGGIVNYLRADGTWAIPAGTGMNNPMTAAGDIIIGGASGAAGRLAVGSEGQVLGVTSGLPAWVTPAAPGTGTVTSVSVVSENGLAGTVATATTTPSITLSTTITGMLKGNGTAISAATSGTDYSAGTAALTTGILKSTTSTGDLSIAVAADFPTLNQNTTGNAATASKLDPGAEINGVAFDGSSNVTVTAAADTLTGTTLAPNVTASSLTSVGTLVSLDVMGNIAAGNFSGSSSGTNTGDQTITLTGDVTGSGTGSFATTVASAPWSALTGVPIYSGSAIGLVPAGSGGTTNFLREDGSWAAPPTSSGTVTSFTFTNGNGFTGTVTDSTTTPTLSLGTSITGILYGNGTAVAAATAADFPTLNQNTTGSSGSLSPGAEINGVNFTGTSAITVGAAWADVTGTPTTLAGYGITDALENPMTTAGDMIIGGTAGAPQRLAAGAAGTMLASVSGAPAWGNATELDYASGASVDSLMPAEAGADVTATHTSALASTLANQSATALKLNLVWNPDWDIYALAAGTNPPTVITEDGSTSAPSTSATFPAGAAGYASSRVELHNSPDFSIVSGQTYTAVSTIQLSRALVGGESVTVYLTGVDGGWETTIVQGDAGSDGSTVTLPPLSYTAAADGQDYFVIYATCTTALTVYSSNRQFFMTGGGQHAQSVTIPGASNAKAYVNFGDTTTGGHVGLGGAGTLLQSNGTSLQWTAAPTLSSITIDGGTVYQNTSGRWMNLYVGFSTVSTGTVQTFLGPTSSPSLTRSDDVVGNRTITLRVPPGWYYEFSGLATSGSSYALYEN